jgi:hypothetical protein
MVLYFTARTGQQRTAKNRTERKCTNGKEGKERGCVEDLSVAAI